MAGWIDKDGVEPTMGTERQVGTSLRKIPKCHVQRPPKLNKTSF